MFPPRLHQVTHWPLPRKKKGDIKKDLVNEYEALGRPGAGKCLQQVMQDVEDEMSKNLAFKIEKSGKCIWLHCGKRKVQLKEGWKLQIFKEPSGIPFLSTGKVSKGCVRFFDDEKEEEARTKDASVEVAAVPLPGAPTPSTAAPSATEADQGLCFQKTLEGNVGNRNCEVNSQ